MGTTTAIRIIQAPIHLVFESVGHIENYAKVVPEIIRVEFLSEQKSGLGARFRETRQMGKREGSTELEVTEYEPSQRIRLVADQGGTIWDTIYTTRELEGGRVELKLVMEARAYKFLAKLFNPLIAGVVRKAIEKDMDRVKAHCEEPGAGS